MIIFNPKAKLLWHGDRIKEWLHSQHTIPILIEIAPTGYCNAKCPWCFFEDKKTSEKINSDVMIKVLKDISNLGIKAINWTGGGEPTLHPDFATFVTITHECGLKQGLFTNGYTIIPCQDKFEWIRISLTNKEYKVIKKPEVPFGICVNQIKEQTEKKLRKLCIEAKNFGASYFQIRPALLGSCDTQPKLDIPEYLKEYEDDNFKVYVTPYKYREAVKEREYNECYGFKFCPSIDWNGKLGVCLYMMNNPKYVLGDLNKNSFESIWKNSPDKVNVISTCQLCCKNNEVNDLLYKTKHITQTDFI